LLILRLSKLTSIRFWMYWSLFYTWL